jgi:hypothetical protein
MELSTHFRKHGHKFGVTTETDYEQLAEQFLFGAMDGDTQDCIRPDGIDRVRFKNGNRHLGVAIIAPGFVRTFYPVEARHIARCGGATGYLAFECNRRFP